MYHPPHRPRAPLKPATPCSRARLPRENHAPCRSPSLPAAIATPRARQALSPPLCRDRAPARHIVRARRRSLDARNAQGTKEHQPAAGGELEIRRRPSVCAGGDQVAAERLHRSRSGGGRAGAPVEIRPPRWQAGACSLLIALASRCVQFAERQRPSIAHSRGR